MNHHLGHRHIHRIEPICPKTAVRIARRIPLNPPPIPTWAQIWRTA